MVPPIGQQLILFVIGVVTGFINILAGGGSLLTLPILIFFGLPTATANGTNRIAILIQNMAAITGFHQNKVFPWRVSLLATLPALLGAILGARIAVDIPDDTFKQLLAVIMIVVLVIIIVDPMKKIRATPQPLAGRRRIYFLLGFFFIGLYGGFIQAGVGFMVIVVMLLAGFDMVQTNAVKVLVIFLFTIAALGVFIQHGQVSYLYGMGLGAGNAVGGYWASHVAVKKGHGWIRGFVVISVVFFAAKLLYDSLF